MPFRQYSFSRSQFAIEKGYRFNLVDSERKGLQLGTWWWYPWRAKAARIVLLEALMLCSRAISCKGIARRSKWPVIH